MTVKALRFFTTVASVGVLGATFVYTPVSQAFNFGDMMNPGKWMGGGNREKMTAIIESMDLYTKNVIVDFKKVTDTDSATVAALMGRFMDMEKFKAVSSLL